MSWTYATLLALLAAFLALSRESDAGESSFFRACRVMIAVCIIFLFHGEVSLGAWILCVLI